MAPDRISRLSEGQRECLRMVYRHMETKEIARTLGISPDGVAQRIKTAMRILGVHRRRDAARMLAEAEGGAQAPSIVGEAITARPDEARLEPRLREEQAVFQAVLQSPVLRLPLPLPLPLREARPNDAGWLRRLAWIAGIAIGGALAFGTLTAGVEALARLFTLR